VGISDFIKLNPSKNKGVRKSMPEDFFQDVKEMTRDPKGNWKRHTYRPPTPDPQGYEFLQEDPLPTGTGPVSLAVTPKSTYLEQEKTELPSFLENQTKHKKPILKPLEFAKGGAIMQREAYATGGIKSIISNLLPSLYKNVKKTEMKNALDFGYNPSYLYQSPSSRKQQQEGGPINEQMADVMPEEEIMPIEMAEEPTETMLPDEEMEGNYIDFVIDEALTTEEEQYLLDRLGGDDRLSMIFDKVVETASEFSGAGSVEGPGNAVSDSIPARLSDGEFVMTSKAANQIGPDNLHGLMEVAEAEADDEESRRTAQAGGYVQEEEEEEEVVQPIASEKVLPTGRILPESEVSKRAKANADLLNPRMSLFAS